MRSLLLLGGGGHCRSVYDSLSGLKLYDRVGLVIKDITEKFESDIQIVGCDDDLRRLFADGWDSAFVTVGSVSNSLVREHLFYLLCEIGFNIPNIIDNSAVVAANSKIEQGCYVGKHAIVNAYAHISECAIINTGAIIEHDCKVGCFSHISTGAILCGNVCVGNYSHIGAGAVVKQGIQIGNRTTIGMGSVVTHSFACNIKAYGNPCKEVLA